jgi:phosphatidylglycerophosphatase A
MTQLPVPNARRVIDWKRFTRPYERTALAVATAGGIGLIPVASGTFGTLVGIPIHWFSAEWDFALRVLLWGALFAAGVWAGKVVDQTMGSGDHSCIVMDEVVGYGVTAWTCGFDTRALIAAFLLFRLLDIVKPWPVRKIDTWSKKKALASARGYGSWWGGFGVMGDDLAASFMGLALIAILQRSGLWFS